MFLHIVRSLRCTLLLSGYITKPWCSLCLLSLPRGSGLRVLSFSLCCFCFGFSRFVLSFVGGLGDRVLLLRACMLSLVTVKRLRDLCLPLSSVLVYIICLTCSLPMDWLSAVGLVVLFIPFLFRSPVVGPGAALGVARASRLGRARSLKCDSVCWSVLLCLY